MPLLSPHYENIVPWVECVFLAKPIGLNPPPWKVFYKQTRAENKLIVLFAHNMLKDNEFESAQKLISLDLVFEQRAMFIREDMKRLKCDTIKDYLNKTDKSVYRQKSSYKQIIEEP